MTGSVATPARRSAAGRRARLVPALSWLSLLAGAIVWQLVGTLNPHLMAPLTSVLASGVSLAHGGQFWGPVGVTVLDMFIGFAFAFVVGLPLGVGMGLNATTHRIADMYLNWMLSIPEVALIPFFMIAFGLGFGARMAVIFVFALPVIVQNTLAGIVGVSPNLTEMARSFEVGTRAMILKVLVPAALPMILTGARMGLARSLLGIIAAGFFIQLLGLGGQIFYFENTFQLGHMFFAIFMVIVISLLVQSGMERLNARLTHWNRNAAA